jgi:protein O-mannosyl-transferase
MQTRLALLAAALAAFGGSLASGFHFDDYAIFQGAALHSPLWSLQQTRPLTYLTFWLNYQAGGRNPLGYHAVNLALHLAAVWLLYEALRRLVPPEAAFIAAAIFAVHPIQAEAVDYIWGRSIVLAAVFCFASLLEWTRGRPWSAVAWFAAALLSKEEVAAFPVALIVGRAMLPAAPFQAARRLKTGGSRDWLPDTVMLVLSLVAGARVIYATAVTPGAPAGIQAGISPLHYFLAQGPVIWRYFRLLVVPVGFTVDPEIQVPPISLGVASWLALAVCVVVARRWKAAGWLLIGLVLLLPSSSIFPAQDLSADRRMYFPLAAFATAFAMLPWPTHVSRRVFAAAAIAIFTVLSILRTHTWQSDEALWREAVLRAPNKIRPKIQLSRSVSATEALKLLSEARRLSPGDPAIATETGKVLLAQGDDAAALSEFGRALALDPRDAQNYNNRGVALQSLGLREAARQDYARALAIDPSLTEARRNLQSLEP